MSITLHVCYFIRALQQKLQQLQEKLIAKPSVIAPNHSKILTFIFALTLMLQKLYLNYLVTTCEAAWCIISRASVGLYVCQTITFESLDRESWFSLKRYISMEYGSSSYMKVIGSRSREQKKSKTSIGNNSVSITHRVMKFLAKADRMVWPLSSPRNRKWPLITKCTHSPLVPFLTYKSQYAIFLIFTCIRQVAPLADTLRSLTSLNQLVCTVCVSVWYTDRVLRNDGSNGVTAVFVT